MTDLRKLNLELTKKGIAESVKGDVLIIQALHVLEELDNVIKRLSVSLKEGYSYYAPSVLKLSDTISLIRLVKIKKKEEMGGNFSEEDLKPYLDLALELEGLIDLKEKQQQYLENLMKKICPNLLKVAGTNVGAKLISLAGSMKHLAELSSSTIQVFGAEKALFKHLHKKTRPPKFGVIYMHPSISSGKDKAKVARKLATEISLAVRKDYFRK